MSDQPKKTENIGDQIEKTKDIQSKTSFRPKLRHVLVMLFMGIVLSGATVRTLQIISKQKPSIEPIAQDPNTPLPLLDRNGFPNLNPAPPADA